MRLIYTIAMYHCDTHCDIHDWTVYSIAHSS